MDPLGRYFIERLSLNRWFRRQFIPYIGLGFLLTLPAAGGSLVDSECTAFRWAVNEAQRPDVILLYVRKL